MNLIYLNLLNQINTQVEEVEINNNFYQNNNYSNVNNNNLLELPAPSSPGLRRWQRYYFVQFFFENICFPTQVVAKCCWPELPLPTDAKEVSEWIDAASSCTCYCAMCWIVTSNQKRICPCMWWGRCTGTWQCRAPLFKPTDLIRLKQAPFTEQPETTTTNVTVK